MKTRKILLDAFRDRGDRGTVSPKEAKKAYEVFENWLENRMQEYREKIENIWKLVHGHPELQDRFMATPIETWPKIVYEFEKKRDEARKKTSSSQEEKKLFEELTQISGNTLSEAITTLELKTKNLRERVKVQRQFSDVLDDVLSPRAEIEFLYTLKEIKNEEGLKVFRGFFNEQLKSGKGELSGVINNLSNILENTNRSRVNLNTIDGFRLLRDAFETGLRNEFLQGIQEHIPDIKKREQFMSYYGIDRKFPDFKSIYEQHSKREQDSAWGMSVIDFIDHWKKRAEDVREKKKLTVKDLQADISDYLQYYSRETFHTFNPSQLLFYSSGGKLKMPTMGIQ